jgi:hypothetical protein
VLVIKFERLVADTQGCLSDAAAFLGVRAEHAAIEAAVVHHDPASMRHKERVAHAQFRTHTDPRRSFVRSARSGDWRTVLSNYDIRLIEDSFGGAMAQLGYGLTTKKLTGSELAATRAGGHPERFERIAD